MFEGNWAHDKILFVTDVGFRRRNSLLILPVGTGAALEHARSERARCCLFSIRLAEEGLVHRKSAVLNFSPLSLEGRLDLQGKAP